MGLRGRAFCFRWGQALVLAGVGGGLGDVIIHLPQNPSQNPAPPPKIGKVRAIYTPRPSTSTRLEEELDR